MPVAALLNLSWTADAPGPDPTARFTAPVAINGQRYHLAAHRVQRPVAAGWVTEPSYEAIPSESDANMAVDGPGWRKWWCDYEAIPVREDFDPDDIPPEPRSPNEAFKLEQQHAKLWELLCNTDHLFQVWCRPEGAYLLFGWPVDGPTNGLVGVEVDFKMDNDGGWGEVLFGIEGVPCRVAGPTFRWNAGEQRSIPSEVYLPFIKDIIPVIECGPILLDTEEPGVSVLALVGPVSEGTTMSLETASNRQQVRSVVFLDLDGVITSRRVHVAFGDSGPWSRPDPVAIGFVDRLVAEAGAAVVISSSWRKEESREAILALLAGAGFTGRLHDDWATPVLEGRRRGDEVADWLARHPEVTRWADLDDDASGFHRGQRVVTTSPEEGFLLAHYLRARVLLGLAETVQAAEPVDLEQAVRAAADAARKGRFKEAARLAIAAERLLG